VHLLGLDHVQIAIPVGGEDRARAFYVGVLGLREVPKPPVMAVRGGAWFVVGEQGLHVGVEDPFVPAKKAHPAFRLASVRWSNETADAVRFHTDDPFGNRLELTAPA